MTPSGGFAGSADALVSTEPGVPLAIFTADCLAIVLYDAETRALAAAHVGWRGTVGGAAQATVAALVELGARPERLRVAIAPSIGPCCYEIDEPVVAALRGAYPSLWERWVTAVRPGHWHSISGGRTRNSWRGPASRANGSTTPASVPRATPNSCIRTATAIEVVW